MINVGNMWSHYRFLCLIKFFNIFHILKFKKAISRICHRISTLLCDQIEKRYKFINGLMEQTMSPLRTLWNQSMIKLICGRIGAFQPSTFFAIVFFSFYWIYILLDYLNLIWTLFSKKEYPSITTNWFASKIEHC